MHSHILELYLELGRWKWWPSLPVFPFVFGYIYECQKSLGSCWCDPVSEIPYFDDLDTQRVQARGLRPFSPGIQGRLHPERKLLLLTISSSSLVLTLVSLSSSAQFCLFSEAAFYKNLGFRVHNVSIVGRVLSLHTADLDLIFIIPYGIARSNP